MGRQKLKTGDTFQSQCRKCGAPTTERVAGVAGGLVSVTGAGLDCGKHKEEYEKVKDDYNCYIDFIYDIKKKERR